MATQPQPIPTVQTRAEINKQNAQHSTGPRTAEGRQRVRTNALKHGLTAKEVFLVEGESDRYEALLDQLNTRWRAGEHDGHDLILSLRDAMWRLNSIPVLQINLTTLSTEEHMEAYEHLSDKPAAQRCAAHAAGYRANAKLFDQLSRHELRLERKVRDIEAQLDRILQERIEAKQTQAHQEAQQKREEERVERERLERIARQQAEQVAADLAAQKAEAAKQTHNPARNNPAKQTQTGGRSLLNHLRSSSAPNIFDPKAFAPPVFGKTK